MNKWKIVLNLPRLNSAIDFRLLAVLELTKMNEKQRLAEGGFEPAKIFGSIINVVDPSAI